MVFRPVSSGTVRLASTNPNDSPLIDPNYFGNPQDLVAMVKTMSTGLGIAESQYMSPYISPVNPQPGCEQTFCNDRPLSQCLKYLACVAQTFTFSTWHPCGSVPMGNATSSAAVLDERLRVRNVRNLRVIDSSIFPNIPNANINAPTMMVGEKGVHMVLQDNGLAV